MLKLEVCVSRPRLKVFVMGKCGHRNKVKVAEITSCEPARSREDYMSLRTRERRKKKSVDKVKRYTACVVPQRVRQLSCKIYLKKLTLTL